MILPLFLRLPDSEVGNNCGFGTNPNVFGTNLETAPAFKPKIGTIPHSSVTSRNFIYGALAYLCRVSFHAHIWLVIDFRVLPPAPVKDLYGRRQRHRRSLVPFAFQMLKMHYQYHLD